MPFHNYFVSLQPEIKNEDSRHIILFNMGLLQDKLSHYTLPQEFMARGIYPYFREIEGKQGTEVMMGGKRVLMFGSNAYTGLPGDQRIIDAGCAAMQKYGSGCAGSRFLNGTLDIHVQLEKELAEFVGKDEALIFSTGFTVNSGVISQLVGKNDYVICDDRDHASIVDGRRLSFATQLKFKHNDMADLEKQLQRCEPEAIKLIVVDGVFSMEGDLCKLPEIVELKMKYNATIMVDEAHGIGVFGRQGRGVCDHFGLTKDVDLIMGTFSKSLASIGGCMLTSHRVADWLRHVSRPFIFSASITPCSAATALEALHQLILDPKRPERLMNIAKYFQKQLLANGVKIIEAPTPIVPIFTYKTLDTLYFGKKMFEEGVYVNPVIAPACVEGECLLRTTLMATHTEPVIDEAVAIIARVLKEGAPAM